MRVHMFMCKRSVISFTTSLLFKIHFVNIAPHSNTVADCIVCISCGVFCTANCGALSVVTRLSFVTVDMCSTFQQLQQMMSSKPSEV